MRKGQRKIEKTDEARYLNKEETFRIRKIVEKTMDEDLVGGERKCILRVVMVMEDKEGEDEDYRDEWKGGGRGAEEDPRGGDTGRR